MIDFYNLNDPIVRSDVEHLYGKSTMYVLNYLVDKLKRLEYRNYGKKDTFKTPYEMFSSGDFDCEDGIGYVASVLRSLGIPHKIFIGRVEEYPQYYHVWIELDVNGEVWIFEATAPMVLPEKDVEVHYVKYMEVAQ